jgi:hypothetical protein
LLKKICFANDDDNDIKGNVKVKDVGMVGISGTVIF